jgi:lipoprotein-anchoring transpeptidase ErfK/SrfK
MYLTDKLSHMDDDKIKNQELQSESEPNGSNTRSSSPHNEVEEKPGRSPLLRLMKTLLYVVSPVVTLFLLFLFVIYLVPFLQEKATKQKTAVIYNEKLRKDPAYKKQITLMSKDVQRMRTKYVAYTSGQSYIIINTTENRFFLYKNKKLVRTGFCSSGSYIKLQTEGNKQYTFKTPKGKWTVLGKKTNPVWKKPDWAFLEEGLPIPSANAESRFEYGVLGDYALTLGDGYMIHGTIYKRFLGMPVTHGCVRLSDPDLEAVYNTLNVGSKVYIF